MNNLFIQSIERIGPKDPSNDCNFVDICLSNSTDRLILTRDGKVICLPQIGGEWTVDLNLALLGPSTDWFSIVQTDNSEIACLSRSGAIVTISSEREVELVGEFDNGIFAAKWSPDKEILVLVTHVEGKLVLLSMNSNFEVLAEAELCTVPENGDDSLSSVSLAWRPDGSLIAVNFLDESTERKIQLYNRNDLAFHAIGRTEDGSGKLVNNIQSTPIAWAGPNCSQILASVQRKSKKTTQIAFFEPNGLRHREFPLREGPGVHVKTLAWSCDSTLFGMIIAGEKTDKLQLWHRNNYHWYMKQEIRFDSPVEALLFDENTGNKLSILFQGKAYYNTYTFRWSWSDVRIVGGSAAAYVVDGCELQITELQKATIPPPMSHTTLSFPATIVDFAFTTTIDSTFESLVVLSSGEVYTVKKDSDSGISRSINPSFDIPNVSENYPYRNLVIVDSSTERMTFVLVGNGDKLSVFTKGDGDGFALKDELATSKTILRVANWSDSSEGAIVEFVDGSLQELVTSDDVLSLADVNSTFLMEPCPWIVGLHSSGESGDRVVIGVSENKRLFLGDVLLSDSVSSFGFSRDHKFLAFVTLASRCQLRFVSLFDLQHFDPLMGADEPNILGAYEPRAVERGAALIAMIPGNPSVVLQMPRGNLECIYPRALVLQYCMRQIIERDYRGAFLMMRKQKVDLNLMIDMNPRLFLERNGFELLVKQIPEVDYLNLFISTLQNGNVCDGRFNIPSWMAESYPEWFEESKGFDYSGKINSVCTNLRQVLLKLDAEEASETDMDLFLSILTTFAKEEPPRLEDALSLIKARGDQNTQKPLFDEKSQHSIHYLAFLADYELLFSTALSMYDYSLARAVARNSQMDPRLYLPLLQRYRDLPEYYARYEVDLKLGRFDMALKNLVRAATNGDLKSARDKGETNEGIDSDDGFNECCRLIKEHDLFSLGLQLFDNDRRREVALLLFDNLMKDHRYKAALSVAMAFSPVDIERAKAAARAAYDWRTFFDLYIESEKITESNDDGKTMKLSMMAHEMADLLIAKSESETGSSRRRLLGDASQILLDYADDTNKAIDTLVQAKDFKNAARLATMETDNREHIRARVKAAALEAARDIERDFEHRANDFKTTFSRFQEVLKKIKAEGKYIDSDLNEDVQVKDDDSLFSAASGASVFSTASGRSAYSTSSTGSTGSISSVISLKSATSKSFSITGSDMETRHHSKFGQKRKKKKRVKKGSSKIRPGSEGELKELAGTLVSDFLDDEDRLAMEETLSYLNNAGEIEASKSLFDAFRNAGIAMNEVLQEFLTSSNETDDHSNGGLFVNDALPDHPLEKKIKALSLPGLDNDLLYLRNLDI